MIQRQNIVKHIAFIYLKSHHLINHAYEYDLVNGPFFHMRFLIHTMLKSIRECRYKKDAKMKYCSW